MYNRDRFNLGNEIRNIIRNAVDTRDFRGLNHDIRNMVNRALNEAGITVKRDSFKDIPPDPQGMKDQRKEEYRAAYEQPKKQEELQKKENIKPAKVAVPVGQVSGMLQLVLGIIGTVLFGFVGFLFALAGLLIANSAFLYIFLFGLLPCTAGSLVVAFNGSSIRQRLKRFQVYMKKMDGRSYILIKDLSVATGKSEKFIVKDLQKMIAKGMFPEGHIDDKKTCFMLNNEVFRQYLLLKESMKMKEIEENEKRSKESIQHESMDPAVRKAIEEGRSYVKRIREANYAIQNVEISRKLDKLEEVTERIFDYVETRPHKLPEIRKFVGYFLPTTLKLLDAYRELDSQSVQGKNISSAKAEIEQSLDTINTAFDNLLDGLFEEIAMDISTDISVLETMFAQEGLTRNKKSPKNENEG
jgi:5-bromo-4-chloroindolyl phosphate hydrolysis protein